MHYMLAMVLVLSLGTYNSTMAHFGNFREREPIY